METTLHWPLLTSGKTIKQMGTTWCLWCKILVVDSERLLNEWWARKPWGLVAASPFMSGHQSTQNHDEITSVRSDHIHVSGVQIQSKIPFYQLFRSLRSTGSDCSFSCCTEGVIEKHKACGADAADWFYKCKCLQPFSPNIVGSQAVGKYSFAELARHYFSRTLSLNAFASFRNPQFFFRKDDVSFIAPIHSLLGSSGRRKHVTHVAQYLLST